MTISNHQYTRALGSILHVHIPWPDEVLGAYGRRQSGDDDMDAWILRNLDTQGLSILSIHAGRAYREPRRRLGQTGPLYPCVVVAIADESTAAQMAALVREGRGAYVSERHQWIDGCPAS